MSVAAVVFDIGGVVQDSPLHAIARYERDRAIANWKALPSGSEA